MIKEKDTQILMSIGFLLLMGVIMLSQPYFGPKKLIDMIYIPMEDYVEFAAHKLKGKTAAW